MPEQTDIKFGELFLSLLPSGAAFSHDHRTLFVADVHLGKAASYRRLGQPVPQGTTTQTLQQLSNDIDNCKVKHLVVLGDLLHGPLVHKSSSTLEAIARWRTDHLAMQITLIRGNHDDRAGDPPAALDIDVVDEPFIFASVVCRHEMGACATDSGFVMSGHIHPVVVLQGRARERLRLACFVVGEKHLILPAYGAFTGGHAYNPSPNESLYVIADQVVMKLPRSS
ncbi:ligase-associated DNA damage response endonuclease PdeM [Orrella daihaiensis]|uniref:Ligase-associated DNA damage response endonuclease PdeM n=1 Tax=Orrella daihaiensis TaxID=2782176 RepID=A0ABY4AHJ7_9BURK|nr:ligase-associated DNA damage response endonuclease PdeM [Orrella daihaiensis]UOD49383.1 ligase-associated DNA damage response endonuclease PdeM [Orrella daihaiensis]